MTIGMGSVAGLLLSWRHTSVPGTSGRFRSSRIRSGWCDAARKTASLPVEACTVRYPAFRRLKSSRERRSFSSSTIRTSGATALILIWILLAREELASNRSILGNELVSWSDRQRELLPGDAAAAVAQNHPHRHH